MITKAIQSLKPGAQWVLRGSDYSGLEWLDTDVVKPTEAAITAEVSRLEQEYIDTQYQRDRAVEYAKLNQDELRFDDEVNGTTIWVDTIIAIKAQFPKPSA